MAGRMRRRFHRLWCSEAQRVDGGYSPKPGQARKLIGALSRSLRLKVPKRAIERIPRRACLKQIEQFSAAGSSSNCVRKALDCGRDPFDGFTIPLVRRALTASPMPAIFYRGDHDPRLSAASSRNGKHAGDGPAFDIDLQSSHELMGAGRQGFWKFRCNVVDDRSGAKPHGIRRGQGMIAAKPLQEVARGILVHG